MICLRGKNQTLVVECEGHVGVLSQSVVLNSDEVVRSRWIGRGEILAEADR